MSEISIPFRDDMAALVVAGKKDITTRSKAYGNVDDTFPVSSGGITKRYRLVSVEK